MSHDDSVGVRNALDEIEAYLRTGASTQTQEYARLAAEFARRITSAKMLREDVKPFEQRLNKLRKDYLSSSSERSVELSDKTHLELRNFMQKLQSYFDKVGLETDVDVNVAIGDALFHADNFYDDDVQREAYLSAIKEDFQQDLINGLDSKQRKKLIRIMRQKLRKQNK